MSKPENILQELLDLIGREDLPKMSPEDINDILQRGAPVALKEQLNLIVGATQEKTKAWMIKEWLDRAGYTPITKIAIAKKIQLDEKTLRVLAKIAGEEEDDSDGELCEAIGQAGENGSGSDPAQLEATVQEVAVLPVEGDPRVSGSDSEVSPQDVSVRTGSDDKT